MSSWKKAYKANQKKYRERHQPESRSHLGLLEKKKDYRQRARDAERKNNTLRALYKRALNKNPDEFYYHMIRSKLHEGEHHESDVNNQKDEHTKDQIALMETQDLKYVRMKRTIEAKKIQRLQAQLHMIDYANTIPNKHTFFVDNEDGSSVEVANMSNIDLAKKLDTHPDLLHHKTNRPRLSNLEKLNMPEIDPKVINAANALKLQSYQELAKRMEREKQLAIVQQKLEIKNVLKQPRLLKPIKKKAGTKTAPPVYQFPYERKK